MATTNIQELLTQGLFTAPAQQPTVDPRARLSGMDLLTSAGLQAGDESVRLFSEGASGLRRELIGLTPEEQLAEELQQLNLETPEGLTRLAEIQRMTGDLEGSLQTLGTLQGMAQEQTLREGLIKIARQQDDEDVITFLEAGGSLDKAADRLFSDKTVKAKTYSLSKGDIKEYDLYFEDYDENYLESIGYDTPLLGKIRKRDKNILYNLAEQIFTNNPELGRRGALAEALRQQAGGVSSDVPSAPSTGNDKFGEVTDD